MPLDLTIAIPAHNDHDTLEKLISCITALKLAREIIVVDDGSIPCISLERLRECGDLSDVSLRLQRHENARGAGAARNHALSLVSGSYLLFLDADDQPTRELRGLCQMLERAQPFDFCIFQHHDSRMERDNQWGMMDFDQGYWREAGLAQRALSLVSEEAAQQLVQTANYPWNKIYRTEFLREHNILCSETKVHNDIELHWRSFFHAKAILSSDSIGVTHFVNQTAQRLTNYVGQSRLDVFVPLERLGKELAFSSRLFAYHIPFYRFALGLLLWVKHNLSAEFHPELTRRTDHFIEEYMSENVRFHLKMDAPDLWHAIEKEIL
jgi:glycosyltransferase involved in cell wall biosynthesis